MRTRQFSRTAGTPALTVRRAATVLLMMRRTAMTLLLMLLTTASAWADTADTYYIDASGTRHDVTATVLTGSDQASITELGSKNTETWYVV